MKNFFAMFVIFIFIGFAGFFSGCGENQQLPKPVCQYGGYVTQLGEYLCNNVPEIPPEVCTLIHLAKINLDLLCQQTDEGLTDGNDKYDATVSKLNAINIKLGKAFKKYNLSKQE